MTVHEPPTRPAGASQAVLDQSFKYCEHLARTQAKNFYYSFVTLPPERRAAMCAVYAFMRYTDDVSDDEPDSGTKEEALQLWRSMLDRALAGDYGDNPILPAFHATLKQYDIPDRYFRDVIDGVEMDFTRKRYETFEELYRYCYHVASVVGFVCMHIWGFDEANGDALRYGEACGLAFQLTNVIRDLTEDAGRDRIYLPQEDLRRFGVTDEDIKAGRMTDAMHNLLQFQVERAEGYYAEARKLAPLVHPRGRPSLSVMMGIYHGILEAVVHQNYDVFRKRARVSTPRKLAILGGAWLRGMRHRGE
jgi:phytoene synthase